jgi:hypothetical protein
MRISRQTPDEQAQTPPDAPDHDPQAPPLAPEALCTDAPVPLGPDARNFLGAEAVPLGTPFDDAPLPEPTDKELLCYRVNAVLDRLVLISDHLQAIGDHFLDIARRQDIVCHHCAALRAMLEKEIFP